MPYLDLSESRDVQRLSDAVTRSHAALRGFREKTTDAWRELGSKWYGDNDVESSSDAPLNYLDLARSIYTHHLAASNPQVLCTTHQEHLQGDALRRQLAVNKRIQEMDLEQTLQDAVGDALFNVGIVHLGLVDDGTVELQDFNARVGSLRAMPILFDYWVHDMEARRWEECAFMGDRCRVTRDVAEERQKSGYWDPGVRLQFRGLRDETEYDRPETEDIAHDRDADDSLYEYVDVWRLWLPPMNRIIELCADAGQKKILRDVAWEGPKGGPYHILDFARIPGNVMPVAPVLAWRSLCKIANKLYRKLGDQGLRQKNVAIAQKGADSDARVIKDLMDGEVALLDNPQSVEEFSYGGISEKTLLFLTDAVNRLSYFAGNLDTLGGLSTQADTLGQEQLLAGQSSKRVEYMVKRVMRFTTRLVRDIAWYQDTDPFANEQMQYTIPGTSLDIPMQYSADTRKGDFLDFDYQLVPYSMQPQSPSQRIQSIAMLFERFIAPMLPQMEAQGMYIDVQTFVQLLSQYANLPELGEVIRSSGITGMRDIQGKSAEQQRPRQSPVTTRNYVRRNIPGATRQGQDQVMQQLLAGGSPQNAQMASLFRGAE